MGFNAIWISPVVEQTKDGFHGYWTKNFSKINPFFGTEQDFIELIEVCHENDIYIMLDVVLNHIGPVGYDYSEIFPFNNSNDYHTDCEITDFTNQTEMDFCRLMGLPDLAQENSIVADQLSNYVMKFRKMGIDGFRLDTACYVFTWFLQRIQKEIDPMIISGEVNDISIQPNVPYVAKYASVLGSTHSYPLYWTLQQVFGNYTPPGLPKKYQIQGTGWDLRDLVKSYNTYIEFPEWLTGFIDNHDNPRFLNYRPSLTIYKNALTFILFFDHIPIVYYGTEQEFHGANDPFNREWLGVEHMNRTSEMYLFLKKILTFKNKVIQEMVTNEYFERYVLGNLYSFSRGRVYVATVTDGNSALYYTTYHPFTKNEEVCDIISGNCVKLNEKTLLVQSEGLPVIFYPKSEFDKL